MAYIQTMLLLEFVPPWASYQIRKIVGCACGNTGNIFPATDYKESTSKRSRHASRHVRHARVMMHVRLANPRWHGKRPRHSRRMQEQIADQFTAVRLCSCNSQLINGKSSVYMPDLLMWRLEVSGDSSNNLRTPSVVASQSMCIMGHMYNLVGFIQMGPSGGHFPSITLSNHGTFVVMDDLHDCVGEFPVFSTAVSRCVLIHCWETPLTPQHACPHSILPKGSEHAITHFCWSSTHTQTAITAASISEVAALPRDPASEWLTGVEALSRESASETASEINGIWCVHRPFLCIFWSLNR